jgi:uncharacterized protein (DUF58 family)
MTASAAARDALDRARGVARRATATLGELLGPAGRRVGAVLAPALSVITPAGWCVLVLVAASLTGAYALGWAELSYLGFAALAALAVCAVFLVGRSTYDVRFALVPPRVTAGEPAAIAFTVANAGDKTVPAGRMELRVGDDVREFAIPRLARQGAWEESLPVPTPRRAVIPVGPAISVRGDALGLLRRTLRWGDRVELFVHPRTIPLEPSAAGLVRDLEGLVTKRITTSDLSFHALRPYVPGDDRRHIHWRATARLYAVTREHLVRIFEETRRSQLTIVHSENRDHYASEEEFELAVSVTASIAQQVIRDGTAASVVSETLPLRTHTGSALLDDSCRLAPVTSRFADMRAFVRDVTRRLPPPSVLVLVGGSGVTAQDRRAVQLLFPGETTVIAIEANAGASPSLGTIAGMLVGRVGHLEDLRPVLRRASGS